MTTDADDLLERLHDSIVGARGLRARIPAPRDGGSPIASAPVVTTDSGGCEPADDAADLYVGSDYLGSLFDLAGLGDMLSEFEAGPDGEFDEAEFERRCAHMLRRVEAGSATWPWSAVDSTSTPWAYVWRASSVQVYRFGALYGVIYPTYRRPRHRSSRSSPFPRMRTEGDENADPSPTGAYGE